MTIIHNDKDKFIPITITIDNPNLSDAVKKLNEKYVAIIKKIECQNYINNNNNLPTKYLKFKPIYSKYAQMVEEEYPYQDDCIKPLATLNNYFMTNQQLMKYKQKYNLRKIMKELNKTIK